MTLTMGRTPMDSNELDQLRVVKRQVEFAVSNGRSTKWCLALWSRFVRARDEHRCVNCGATNTIQAHHIFRRTVLAEACFEPGNGITLCNECHLKAHKIFNGRPARGEPLNARGGDDQDEIAHLYGLLAEDADARELPHDEFYYISDRVLERFAAWQGFESFRDLAKQGQISRLRAAHEIWRNAPEPWYANIASSIGTELLASLIDKAR